MLNKGFYIHNLGCKVNRVESDTMAAALLAAGACSVPLAEASVVLVNSCTVTGEADAKTRKAVRQALAARADTPVIVTGCAVALEQADYARLGARVIVEPDRLRALERAKTLVCTQSEAPCTECDETLIRSTAAFPTRLGIKIQDGCDCSCSYCIVTQARGPSRSESLSTILGQAQTAERAGVREIVLTGVNIGQYVSGGRDLSKLLEELLSVCHGLRFRLSSLEPQYATEELLSLMAASRGRICAHLHLPLQSGSDRTLKEMSRPYDTAFFREHIMLARTLLPQLGLTTDVICGFPGESESDHASSIAFCREMAFSRMHVFRFSARRTTSAAARTDQIDARLLAHRAREMRALARELARADVSTRAGSREWVLVEGGGWGRSESYQRVRVPMNLQTGSLMLMRFEVVRDTLIRAEPLSE
ncbi:MAG: MiaB/RimO family radical SAM methylthiotransferase [Coriobacteriales bacterium]|nr:MiaB/RimO family radical SAM methylthiotransferase [Coriobacteriales bacterium]